MVAKYFWSRKRGTFRLLRKSAREEEAWCHNARPAAYERTREQGTKGFQPDTARTVATLDALRAEMNDPPVGGGGGWYTLSSVSS